MKVNSSNGSPLAHDTDLDDPNSSSRGQGVLSYGDLCFALELYFLFQQNWMVYGGEQYTMSSLREGLAVVLQDAL